MISFVLLFTVAFADIASRIDYCLSQPGTEWKNNNCTCLTGFKEYRGRCVCANATTPYLTPDWKQCVAKCPDDTECSSTSIDFVCECKGSKKYDPLKNKCVDQCELPLTERYYKTCQCTGTDNNYLLDEIKNSCAPKCHENANLTVVNGLYKCYCPADKKIYDEVHKQCVASCPKDTQQLGNVCSFKSGVNGLFLVLAMALFFLF